MIATVRSRPWHALLIAVAAVVVLSAAGVGLASALSTKPPVPSPDHVTVTLDDATKQLYIGNAGLDFKGEGEATVEPAVPEGMRLVIETVTVSGSERDTVAPGSEVWDRHNVEHVVLSVDSGTTTYDLNVPLHETHWGTGDSRYWQFSGLEQVRAYVDGGGTMTASAFFPSPAEDETEHANLSVTVLGYLVPMS